MVRFLIALFVFVPAIGWTQYQLNGKITLQNSNNKAVAAAEVSALWANNAISEENGNFQLLFTGKRAGYQTRLSIVKPGYEVVNKDELQHTLRKDPIRLKFYLCPKGEWERNAISYYQINESHLKKRYLAEIERISIIYSEQSKLLEDSLSILELSYQQARSQAKELSEKFAKANLDDATDLFENAFEAFSDGRVKEALNILSEEDLVRQLQHYLAEAKEGKEMVKIGTDKLVEAEEAFKKGIDNFLLKADLLIINYQPEQADLTFKKALKYAPNHIRANYNYANFLLKQNRIEEGIKVSKHCQSLEGISISYRVRSMRDMAVGLTGLSRDQEAVKILEEAVNIFQEATKDYPDSDFEDMGSLMYHLGRAYLLNMKYYEASLAYKEALNIWENIAAQDSSQLGGLSQILHEIGLFLSIGEEFEQASDFFERAIAIRTVLTEKEPDTYRRFLFRSHTEYGKSLIAQNRYPKAMSHLDTALVQANILSKQNPGAYNFLKARALLHRARIQRDQNRFEEASRSFDESLGLMSKSNKILVPDQSEYADVIVQRAYLYFIKNEHENAIRDYKQALGIYQKILKNSTKRVLPDLGDTWKMLGDLYVAQFKLDSADLAFTEAMGIYRALAEDFPTAYSGELAWVLQSYGTGIADLDFSRGLSLLKEARWLYEHQLLEDSMTYLPIYANTLNQLGKLYLDTDSALLGRSYLEKALAILEKFNSPEYQVTYLSALLDYGTYMGRTGEEEIAETSLLKVSQVYKKLALDFPAVYSASYALCLNRLGVFYFETGKYEQAISHFNEELAYWKSQSKTTATLKEMASIYYNLELVYNKMTHYDSAISYGKMALSLYKSLEKENPGVFQLSIAGCLQNLGLTYFKTGQLDSTYRMQREGILAYRQLPPHELSLNQDSYINLLHWFTHKFAAKKPEEGVTFFSDLVLYYNEKSFRQPDLYLPKLANCYFYLAKLFASEKMYEQAIEKMETARSILATLEKKDRNYFITYFRSIKLIGQYHTSSEDFSEGRKYYKKAIKKIQKKESKDIEEYGADWADVYLNFSENYLAEYEVSADKALLTEVLIYANKAEDILVHCQENELIKRLKEVLDEIRESVSKKL